MSGLGRRSHYRKNVTDSVLNNFPEPNEGERIAQVAGSRGGNVLEILVATSSDTSSSASSSSSRSISSYTIEKELAILPTKFRKLIWVRRGNYVIVGGDQSTHSLSEDKQHPSEQQHKVRYMVHHILYNDQIKHLKSLKNNVWPNIFTHDNNKDHDNEDSSSDTDDDDGGDQLKEELFVNTNHIAKLCIHDDDDDDDDESSADDQDDQLKEKLYVNTNHLAKLCTHDDHDESSADGHD